MSVDSNRTIKNIFQEFLQSKGGKFLGQYIHNKDQLPLFKPQSDISLNGDIPATSEGHPSLLLYNLGNLPTKADDILKMALNNRMLVLYLLGTSGCGKTRTCFEILCRSWGIYLVGIPSKKGGGSRDIENLTTYLSQKMEKDNFMQNRNIAENATRCVLLARLLILNHCMKESPDFTKQQWFFLQVAQENLSKKYNFYGDIFDELSTLLRYCSAHSVIESIFYTYRDLNKRPFPIILDEVQVLQHKLMDHFLDHEYEPCSLLFPVIRALVNLNGVSNHCVLPCGTGLGILKMKEILQSGIAKIQDTFPIFTEFGGWEKN